MKKELKERVENALNELEAIKKELNKPTELENGKVYKSKSGSIVFKNSDKRGFGFNHKGKWRGDSYWTFKIWTEEWTEATDEEWLEALSKEADRRGLKDGNFECLIGPTFLPIDGSVSVTDTEKENFFIGLNCAMQDGVWAEVVKSDVDIRKDDKYVYIGIDNTTIALMPNDAEYLRNWLNENK